MHEVERIFEEIHDQWVDPEVERSGTTMLAIAFMAGAQVVADAITELRLTWAGDNEPESG